MRSQLGVEKDGPRKHHHLVTKKEISLTRDKRVTGTREEPVKGEEHTALVLLVVRHTRREGAVKSTPSHILLACNSHSSLTQHRDT
jgi:hypothetical protein